MTHVFLGPLRHVPLDIQGAVVCVAEGAGQRRVAEVRVLGEPERDPKPTLDVLKILHVNLRVVCRRNRDVAAVGCLRGKLNPSRAAT